MNGDLKEKVICQLPFALKRRERALRGQNRGCGLNTTALIIFDGYGKCCEMMWRVTHVWCLATGVCA